MTEIVIRGLAELQKMLDKIPAELESKIMRGALRDGAKVIEAEAKANVPVKSGVLRDSIRVSARKRGRTVTASIKAGGKTKTGDAFYAKWIEFGTAAHDISGKKGGWLSFGGLFTKSVNHPGTMDNLKPFMRPALDTKAGEAVVAVGNYIKKRLTKQGLNTQGIEVTGDNEP